LLGTNEEELPGLIAQLVEEQKYSDAVPRLIKPSVQLYISATQNVVLEPFDVVISCSPEPLTNNNRDFLTKKNYLHLCCQNGKLGSRDLRSQLPHLRTFFSQLPPSPGKLLICCPTGKDLSVGVALVILCLYADDNASISPQQIAQRIDKTYIKQRLSWITTTSSVLNPSRGTLQSVNAFLMPDPTASRSLEPNPTDLPITKLVFKEVDTATAAHEPIDDSSKKMTSTEPPPSIPTTLFATLQTSNKPWTFIRTLSSALPGHPSGTVIGTATFAPYQFPAPSNTSSSPNSTPTAGPPSTLLYSEEGEFVTSTNLRFTTRRKYIYQLKTSVPEPYIAIYFLEEEKGKEDQVGGLFVEMGDLKERGGGNQVLEAKNREQHLCAEDLYTASWRFGRGMVGVGEEEKWWEVRYDVKGPKKDYYSETRYTVA
jgi:tRNA A64-2'-O-ribosylphosphate transferase